MDRLEKIFKLQEKLNIKIGIDVKKMSNEEKIQWILNYTRAMQQEVAELIDSLPWKWWANYQKFDKQNAKVEVIDILHFLISIAQLLDISCIDLYKAYLEKNHVNHHRQESGYNFKDLEDSKHI